MKIGGQEGDIGTVVGANVRLQGTLKDTNEIIVHGTVEGEVISERSVAVSETAMIKGPVSAETVVVSGTVNGSVNAKSKLEITSTGKVFGSITTATLVIQAGALFNGKSVMSEDQTAKEAKADEDKAKEDEAIELE